eukprot:1187002-Prorocentrum_minimum.AAC.2
MGAAGWGVWDSGFKEIPLVDRIKEILTLVPGALALSQAFLLCNARRGLHHVVAHVGYKPKKIRLHFLGIHGLDSPRLDLWGLSPHGHSH